ncbi:ABC transporter ATP-binding protein [Bacteroidetes bacterium endosymbiont of Geopemphigus sp.]|uniref:ABC transporter ATP-binding protein n=1 Tax=Bacteroidetes bacterium endosymbiont of Geopemphigus sp. TaxID=2047937 RepID=UPI000CD0B29E|nr:ABC transporter ATP-binding protein [Bacteroidetes bacterium endosymbiont of Geopemphigus sp.]
MIQARSIYKSFGSLEVLKGVDIDIQEGEVVSITGDSGSGKSTLLQILGSLERLTLRKGVNTKLKLLGQDIQSLSNKELAELRNTSIGFIFQFHHLLPEFTALENVCLPGYIGNREKKSLQKEAKELLEQLGLGERLGHKPAVLSGGEQQRVAIARALINHPKVIFADEPSGNLDAKNSRELHELFFSLRERFKQAFLIVTHNPELAERADRQLHMHEGNLI